jgi:hypothetical protein
MFDHVMESKERTIANNLRRQTAASAGAASTPAGHLQPPAPEGGKRAPRQR